MSQALPYGGDASYMQMPVMHMQPQMQMPMMPMSSTPEEMQLTITNVPENVTEKELRDLFCPMGYIKSVVVAPNPSSGKMGATLSYVTRAAVDAAADAMQMLNGVHKMRSDESPILVSLTPSQGSASSTQKVAPQMQPQTQQQQMGGYGPQNYGYQQPQQGYAQQSQMGSQIQPHVPTSHTPSIPAPPPSMEVQNALANGLGCKLFVGGLPTATTPADLHAIFQGFGNIMGVHLMDPTQKTGDRCAFVTYDTYEEAWLAVSELNGRVAIPPNQLPISVQVARSQGAASGAKRSRPHPSTVGGMR